MNSSENAPYTQTTASLGQLTENYANYNLWANKTLVDWLRTKPAELLEREVASSFPSIKKTLQHIWHTQDYWLTILAKEEPAAHTPEDESLAVVLEGIVRQSAALADVVASIAHTRIEEPILVVSPWFQSDFPAFEYLMHCVNHSTYHRGQVVTIGRQLGFTDAPMTDYNFYNVMVRLP